MERKCEEILRKLEEQDLEDGRFGNSKGVSEREVVEGGRRSGLK